MEQAAGGGGGSDERDVLVLTRCLSAGSDLHGGAEVPGQCEMDVSCEWPDAPTERS